MVINVGGFSRIRFVYCILGSYFGIMEYEIFILVLCLFYRWGWRGFVMKRQEHITLHMYIHVYTFIQVRLFFPLQRCFQQIMYESTSLVSCILAIVHLIFKSLHYLINRHKYKNKFKLPTFIIKKRFRKVCFALMFSLGMS